MSHVERLHAELDRLAQGYWEAQQKTDAVASELAELKSAWSSIGLTSKTPGYDQMCAEIEEFHRMAGSIGAWAFNISAQMPSLKAHI